MPGKSKLFAGLQVVSVITSHSFVDLDLVWLTGPSDTLRLEHNANLTVKG